MEFMFARYLFQETAFLNGLETVSWHVAFYLVIMEPITEQ